ncbi:MAG: AlpA family phage regulatory protein [Halopseudomonas sabulinigri]
MTRHKHLLRIREVSYRTGLSCSSLYNRMNPKCRYYDPSFPRQLRLVSAMSAKGGAVAWDADEIDAWIEGRKQLREGNCSQERKS